MQITTYNDCRKLGSGININPDRIADALGIKTPTAIKLEAASTLREIKLIHSRALGGSDAKKQAATKLEVMISERLQTTATIEGMWEIFNFCPEGSEIEKRVLCQILEASTTIEEVRRVHENTPEGSEIEKQSATKLEVMLSKALEDATTPEEVRDIFGKAPVGSDIEKRSIRVICRLF